MNNAEVEVHGLPGGDGARHLLHVQGEIIGVHAALPVLGAPLELIAAQPEDLEHHLAPGQALGDQVELPDADAVGLGGQAQAFLVGAQRRFHRVLLGDVFEDGQGAQRVALRVALHGGRQQHVDQGAILAHHLVLDQVTAAVTQVAGQDHVAGVVVRLGREEVGRIAPDHLAARVAHLGQPGVTDREQAALRIDRVQHGRR